MKLTHFDSDGNARMVDVGDKAITQREAVAEGFITVSQEIYQGIQAHTMKKGDVLAVAQLAAIMGAKRTSDLIPLCHPLSLTKVDVTCHLEEPEQVHTRIRYRIRLVARVKTQGQTGVEMEALTAVQVGLLTIYDMCKAVDKDMVMGPTYLVEKSGGKSGHFIRRQE